MNRGIRFWYIKYLYEHKLNYPAPHGSVSAGALLVITDTTILHYFGCNFGYRLYLYILLLVKSSPR